MFEVLDKALLDRVFQPCADALDRVMTCFDIAIVCGVAAMASILYVTLYGIIVHHLPLDLAVMLTLCQIWWFAQAALLVSTVRAAQRRFRVGTGNPLRANLVWRLAIVGVLAFNVALWCPLLFGAAAPIAWRMVAQFAPSVLACYFAACTPRPPQPKRQAVPRAAQAA